MRATLDQARAAKAEVLRALEGSPWLRGVGVARTAEGAAVKVNVSVITDEVRAAVPAAVGDVPVLLEEVGEITAPPPPRARRAKASPELRDRLLSGVKRR
jgi:hypothetical protein